MTETPETPTPETQTPETQAPATHADQTPVTVEPPYVPAGREVFWANDQEAGVTTARAPVRDEIDPVAGKRCFRQPLDDGATVVILCFRPQDVVDPGGGAGSRLDAP